MPRTTDVFIPGTYISNGHVYNNSHGHSRVRTWKSDVVRTEAHKLWLKDKTVWLPPTPYTGWYWAESVNPNGVHVYPPAGLSMAGHLAGAESFGGTADYSYCRSAPLWNSDINEQAIFKLRAAIKDQNVNFGAAIAEGGQTISMIAQTAKSLAGAVLDLKHGNLKGVLKHLGLPFSSSIKRRWKKPRKRWRGERLDLNQEMLANRWLELQFGWKPMLSDIQGAAEYLADLATSDPSRLRFSAYGDAYNPLVDFNHGNTGNSNLVMNMLSKAKGKVGIRFIVWYSVVNRNAALAAKSGLVDIASVAWEVTPFSFVADWCVPIGKLLDTCTATAGKEFISGTRTMYIRSDVKKIVSMVSTDQTGVSLYNIDSREIYRHVERTVISEFPLPVVHVKNPLSAIHALDALALLTQRTRSFFT